MKPITVLLADDNRVVRKEIRRVLDSENDFKVVGEAANGRQAVAKFKKLRPELVLMDVAMPLLNGFEATRQILKADPATKVLMLSAHGDEEYFEEAVNSGAVGYLVKQNSIDSVCSAIREVHKGERIFERVRSRPPARLNEVNLCVPRRPSRSLR